MSSVFVVWQWQKACIMLWRCRMGSRCDFSVIFESAWMLNSKILWKTVKIYLFFQLLRLTFHKRLKSRNIFFFCPPALLLLMMRKKAATRSKEWICMRWVSPLRCLPFVIVDGISIFHCARQKFECKTHFSISNHVVFSEDFRRLFTNEKVEQ